MRSSHSVEVIVRGLRGIDTSITVVVDIASTVFKTEFIVDLLCRTYNLGRVTKRCLVKDTIDTP